MFQQGVKLGPLLTIILYTLLFLARNPAAICTRAPPRAAIASGLHPVTIFARNVRALTLWFALPAMVCRIFSEAPSPSCTHRLPLCTSWSQVLICTRSAHYSPDPPQFPPILSAHARRNMTDTRPVYVPFSFLVPLSSALCGRELNWRARPRLSLGRAE